MNGKTHTDRSVVGEIRERAQRSPESAAVYFSGQVLTFGNIEDNSNRIANGLISLGLGEQARVAILSKNTPLFYNIWLGAAKADAVLVPINYRLAPPEISFVLNDSGAQVLFVSQEYLDVVKGIECDLGHVRTIFVIDGETDKGDEFRSWQSAQSPEAPSNPINGKSVSFQMYTSGTTGNPKGALLTHDNLYQALKGAVPVWGPWREHDRILVCMPQYHIGASIWGIIALFQGVPAVLMREFNPSLTLKLIEDFRITKAQVASVMMMMMMDDPSCLKSDLSSLELVIYGAAPASPELIHRAQNTFGCGIAQGYGLTETAGAITYLSPEDHLQVNAGRLKSAGRAIDGIEIRIADWEDNPLPAGKIGEIVCRGRQVAQEYWKLPESSVEAHRGGWFHTGDAGYFDSDGYLYVCDRIKDMIVSGGENIYPAEVENVLYSHPEVAEVAVIGVPDDRWGEVAKAIIVRRPGASVRAEELIEFARARIAHYKAPRSVDFVETLPRNPSGKILKRELRKPFWKNRTSEIV